jgi:ArsR family metal-binding transcriptional regulator
MINFITTCISDPSKMMCRGYVNPEGIFDRKWEEKFDNVKKHPTGLYLLMEKYGVNVMIYSSGLYDVIQAKDEEEIHKVADEIEKFVEG